MSPAFVSVIVPVRNRADLIGPCLGHLLKAARLIVEQGHRLEIVVADDASTDGTAEAVDSMAARSPLPIRRIHLATRHGPARARNAAIEAASGDLIVFADSDVIVDEAFLLAHLEAHRRGGLRALVVGSVITVPSVEAALRRPKSSIWDFSTNPLDTANASVRKEHLQQVGLFDVRFEGMGWEDIDLGLRLIEYGLVRIRARRAVGYHVKPPVVSRAQFELMMAKERERGCSAHLFLAKHPGFTSRLAVQATWFHAVLNWLSRMGGLVTEENVLQWLEWARHRGLPGLELVWLSGVLNQAYLQSFREWGRAGALRQLS